MLLLRTLVALVVVLLADHRLRVDRVLAELVVLHGEVVLELALDRVRLALARGARVALEVHLQRGDVRGHHGVVRPLG